MKNLLFLCGPNGIGKTTISMEIINQLPGSAYVDSDSCRVIYSSLPASPDILRLNLYPEGKDVQKEIFKICKFSGLPVLKEIILGDIGGYSEFVSSVFFADTRNCVLYHLYDDMGADVVAADKDMLRPLYLEFTDWILDYDRERIDEIFAVNQGDKGECV